MLKNIEQRISKRFILVSYILIVVVALGLLLPYYLSGNYEREKSLVADLSRESNEYCTKGTINGKANFPNGAPVSCHVEELSVSRQMTLLVSLKLFVTNFIQIHKQAILVALLSSSLLLIILYKKDYLSKRLSLTMNIILWLVLLYIFLLPLLTTEGGSLASKNNPFYGYNENSNLFYKQHKVIYRN